MQNSASKPSGIQRLALVEVNPNVLRGESGAAFAPELPEEGEDAGRVFL
jgi:hypothetical protein